MKLVFALLVVVSASTSILSMDDQLMECIENLSDLKIGQKRSRSYEPFKPNKKAKIEYIVNQQETIEPIDTHDLAVELDVSDHFDDEAQAEIAIRAHKPAVYLKDLDNKNELLPKLGAILTARTVMVPVHIASVHRDGSINKKSFNFAKYGFFAKDAVDDNIIIHHPRKITHLPESFLRTLKEDEPCDLLVPFEHNTNQLTKINLIPSQKKLGLSSANFENVLSATIYQFHCNNSDNVTRSESQELSLTELHLGGYGKKIKRSSSDLC
ncbi:hypothetical protein Noda2021_08150 [Candidatus Dependentiae bacterium Noda2021]|nr:hypothetical protein Noda2021_08150 [Candidatus Dependentiae bacterium Noda2021]